MKIEDATVGVKVKVPVGKRSECYEWDNGMGKDYKGQKYAYITKLFTHHADIGTVGIGYTPDEWYDTFYVKDLEPYEEETMDEKLVKIEKLEKELAELKALVEADKKPKKDWPDSFEEAMGISKYWGMEEGSNRYLVVTGGTARRLAVNAGNTWAFAENMNDNWAGKGLYLVSFHKFNSTKELYQWMMEGEE